MDVPRITEMCYECTKNASQMRTRCTLNALHVHQKCITYHGMLYGCTTNAIQMLHGCSMAVARKFEGCQHGSRIQYACAVYAEAVSLSLDNLVYLYACLVNFHNLQFLTDSFHIHISYFKYYSQEIPHLVCGRRGDMAIFGDLTTINNFSYKMVFYIETRQLDCDVIMLLL